ncbi:MAG: DNA-directed RNA polymerase subunit beta' [bacterium]|nr:DNA-directed RNA polymerase subunit beta' [bacterium]
MRVEIPDLLGVQKIPYLEFLQKDVHPESRKKSGLEELFHRTFPVVSEDGLLSLEYVNYTLEEPIETIEECIEKKTTYESRLKVKFRLIVKEQNKQTKELQVKSVKEQEIYIGNIPLMTDNGSFIINGVERVIVNQLERCPGVYFSREEEVGIQGPVYSAKIYPARGMWIELHIDTHNLLVINLGRRKVLLSTFLKALGYDDEKILRTFYDDPSKIKSDATLSTTLARDEIKTRDDALKKIYSELKPGYPPILKEAENYLYGLLFTEDNYDLSEAGRSRINKKLGLNFTERHLREEDIIETTKYLLNLVEKGKGEIDDIDHLGNKRVRVSAEIISEYVYEGLIRLARFSKEKMVMVDKRKANNLKPQDIVNGRVFITVMNDFFARNQLSQFLDKINPLAEITHKRRVVAVVREKKRAGFEVRDVHYTHFGRLCPIETPEGANIGLINSLTVYSKIDNLGFIKTPYFKVENGKVTNHIEYLSADREDEYTIAPPDTPVDKKTKMIIPQEVTVRTKGGNFEDVSREKIDYIGISPVQLLSISASLIPFLEHDDSNRALMGSNMQRQAVPLVKSESPLVKTGMEKHVVRDSGVVIKAKADGIVSYVDGEKIVVKRDEKGMFPWEEEDIYLLKNFVRTNQDTCFHQRPIVNIGDRVVKDQIISDGPSVSKNGELALGKNLLVAFMSWGGYNYEDAVILNERVLKEDIFTSIHIKEFEVEARETELGPEEITSDLPNTPEERLKNLDKNGIVRIGAEVEPDDILVGKVTPRGESELTPEEKLLRVIFGEKAKDVQNTSLKVPPGIKGTVINVRKYTRREYTHKENISEKEKAEIKKEEERIKKEIKELELRYKAKENIVKKVITEELKKLAEREKIQHRVLSNPESWEKFINKLTGAHKEKAQKIVDIGKTRLENLEKDLKNEIFKIKKGPDLDPDVITKVVVEIAVKKKIDVGDKMSGRHGNKGVVSRILPEEDMPFLKDGTPVDMILNPLGVPSRMNIGQVLEIHLGKVLKALGYDMEVPVFEGIEEWEIKELFRKAGLSEDGKDVLYDGRTGEPFYQPVTVGYMYMMKLKHLADEKIHARSTGSYSLITQQPLGGRAQFGGQRLGEMEVWALEGYGAAHILKEMLTVKSDDTEGRKLMYESIAKGLNYRGNNIPESFNVLKKELQGLGLDLRIEKIKEKGNDKEIATIKIATPTIMRQWSHGEVKKAETLNYRTFKPEREGLFCEKIFGPVREYECSCGKYKKQRYKGITCDRCGVEVTTSRVRRERMGHIELATPVSYVWLFKSTANWMGLLLDMGRSELEMVLYYERYIVIDPGNTPLKEKDLLTEREYHEYLEKYGNKFKAGIGAEAIQALLKKIDLRAMEEDIKQQLKKKKISSSYGTRRNLVKKLRMVQGLIKTGIQPEFLITNIIMVIPPDLRPLLPLDGGRFVASDLNDLYQRVINRNNRLKKLLQIQAPDIIVRNEKRMLQEAVDALFDNGKHGNPILGKGRRPLKSLADALRGKQGRFRQNLLGKRVDYSGRAVIVVGPELKFNECGLPKEMALELFGPFVLRELRKREYFHTLGSAKKAIRENRPEVWEVLEKVSKHHPVLLNRQPTLHRLSIQAFEPRLIEGNVIKIHPLVCPAFNADFDGDTMSVHLPLTPEACLEAELLLKSTTHILSPANGKPIVSPTRDIVMGCFYLTIMSEEPEYPHILSNFNEAIYLYDLGYLELHRPIKVRCDKGEIITTTVGRIIFNEIIPSGIPYKNEEFASSGLERLIEEIMGKCGYEATVKFLDDVKDLGFAFSTIGGITIGIDDLKIPSFRDSIISEAEKEVAKIKKNYQSGIISEGERYNKLVDLWTSVTNEIQNAVISTLRKDISVKPFRINPIYLMVNSGARGNKSQANQLMGIRGLMIRPKKVTGEIGEIIETPVKKNFKEGLSLLEYFISVHGGRKGLVDTALKTSDAGYLSRKLVDVSHSVIIREEDCGSMEGILISPLTLGDEEILSLKDRITGRVALDNIVDIVTDTIIVRAGEVIDEKKAQAIVDAGIGKIRIRSVLTCRSEKGVCAKCYGWDLSRKKLVNIGEAVGIIAAQSIGEPGTQLTLRTFHTGGAASRGTGASSYKAPQDCVVNYLENLKVVKNRKGRDVVIQREGKIVLYDDRGREIDTYTLRVGAEILVKNGQRVETGKVIVHWDPYSIPVISEYEGTIKYADIEVGKTVKEEIDTTTGIRRKIVIKHKEEMDPRIIILDDKKNKLGAYHIPEDAHIMVEEGDKVYPGDTIAKIFRIERRVQDITGGLPRVTELFEARTPKNPAILSEIEGTVEISIGERGTRKVIISNPETGTRKEYDIPPGKHLLVGSGDVVKAGERITDGHVVLKDILKIEGEKKVQEYLLNEIQSVYRIEGVMINDKHIEIIIRQMLSKVRVEDPGDTYLLEGEEIDRIKIQKINESLPKNKKPATFSPQVLGITRIALSSESFISSASFQETMKVLTNAAILGADDHLEGLKENVILGRLIPSGTGLFTKRETEETTPSSPSEFVFEEAMKK